MDEWHVCSAMLLEWNTLIVFQIVEKSESSMVFEVIHYQDLLDGCMLLLPDRFIILNNLQKIFSQETSYADYWEVRDKFYAYHGSFRTLYIADYEEVVWDNNVTN